MNMRYVSGIILVLSVVTLSACGGGGGGADPNAPASVTLTAVKTVALANNTEALTIQADVRKGDGAAVADGTGVAFSATEGGAPLSSSTASTVNGIASFSVTHAPVSGASKATVLVTAASGGASASGSVRFINQPATVDVFIAFNQSVTGLAGLDFRVNNTAGATFDNATQPIVTMNNAAAGGTIVAGNYNATTFSNRIGLASTAGIETGTTPIIKATYTVAADATSLPVFSIDQTGTFTAIDANFASITSVTAANLVVTATFNTEL